MCEISRKRNNVNGINEDNGSSNTNNRRFNLNISLIPSQSDNFNIVTHRSILNIQTTKLSVKLAPNSELINNKIDPLINNSTSTLNKHYFNNKNIIDRNVTFNNEEDLNERQFSHRFSTSFGADRNIFHHRRSHSHHQYSSFANESLDNPLTLNRSVSVDDGQKQHHHNPPTRNISNILTEETSTTRYNIDRVNLKNISHIELSDDDSHNNNPPKSENINELKSNFKQFHRKTSSFVDCVSLINSRYPTFVTNFNNLSDRIAAAATTTPITTDRSNDFDSITFGRSYTRATQRLNTITAGTNTSTKSAILVNTGQNCPRGERKKDSNKLTRYRYVNLFYSLQLIRP